MGDYQVKCLECGKMFHSMSRWVRKCPECVAMSCDATEEVCPKCGHKYKLSERFQSKQRAGK